MGKTVEVLALALSNAPAAKWEAGIGENMRNASTRARHVRQ